VHAPALINDEVEIGFLCWIHDFVSVEKTKSSEYWMRQSSKIYTDL
jgi:hypothetical protein